METLPRSQIMICRSSSPVKAIIKEINAPKKELKITPVKIIVSTFIERSIFCANKRTRRIVNKCENRILKKGKVNAPIKGIEILKNMVITAPTEAPDETPKCIRICERIP